MFHILKHITPDQLPKRFTYPFLYEAHPLCKQIALELEAMLKEWDWDLDTYGKMFGVLLVKNSHGEIGYLLSYSGNFVPGMKADIFVPPIFDLQAPGSFFTDGEAELGLINQRIAQLSSSKERQKAKLTMEEVQSAMQVELGQLKEKSRQARAERKRKRQEQALLLANDDFQNLEEKLSLESQNISRHIKRQTKAWKEKLQTATEHLQQIENNILQLKEERQEKSATLQLQIFEQYQLLNIKGERKGITPIFEALDKQAPGGTGDCAAPRLLQYAFEHQMYPMAMAEFWMGKSPQSEVRKHGQFYPSCRGKCEPLLEHMLKGLDVDPNPLLKECQLPIEVLYEDDELLVINKPAGMLSVPGKTSLPSVLEVLEASHPKAQSYFMAHRLDKATSGIILIAKDEIFYKQLQALFQERKVKKRYEAILDGVIKEDEGKINLPLRVDLDNRPQQLVCYEYGKLTITIWKVLEHHNKTTRMALYPITGRTHQLRVHSAHVNGLNTPIKGDDLYGSPADRLYLHASFIEFIDPRSGKKVSFKCEVPF